MPSSTIAMGDTSGSFDLSLPQPARKPEDALPPDSNKFLLPREQNGVLREDVGDLSPWIDAFSVDQSATQYVVYVPYEHSGTAIARYLGYSYVNGNKLKRVLPVAHPYFEFMRCRRVLSCQGVKWQGRKPQAPVDLGAAFPRPYYAQYDQVRMVLGFETLPFTLKADVDITYEYERYIYVRPEGGTETLFIDGGSSDTSFKFDSTSTAEVANAVAFRGGKGIITPRPKILCTWYDVPVEWVTKDATSRSYYTNIFAAQGCVNDAAFLGFPKNTLLMDIPQIEIRPNPMPVDILKEPTFLLNITFIWHYFEPTPLGSGVTDNPGHNAGIFRGLNGSPNRYKWFPVSMNGDGVTRPYKSYDFKKLFQKPT